MRTFTTLLLLVLSLTSTSQIWPRDKETNKIVFSEVVIIDSTSKSDLFQRANEWFVNTFNDSKEVIQYSEIVAGKLIGKGSYKIYMKNLGIRDYGLIRFTIAISVKDGRYKYEMYDISHDATGGFAGAASGGAIENEKPECGSMGMTVKQWEQLKSIAYDNCLAVINSLKNGMQKKSSSNNEW